MAATSFMRTWQDFDLIQLVILPMFLFSATFYPLETYPPALQTDRQPGRRSTRASTSSARSRSATSTGSILVHVVYLAVMGIGGLVVVARRLDKLLLK